MKTIFALLLFLSISLKSQIHRVESFHSAKSPIALIGWYKFYPQSGDSLLFDIQVWKRGSSTAGKSNKLSIITTSTSVYKQLNIPIIYTVPPTHCDSAKINIYTSSSPFHGFSPKFAEHKSNIVIDDLQWVYLTDKELFDDSPDIVTLEKIYFTKIESDMCQHISKSILNVIYTVPYENRISIRVIDKKGNVVETVINENQSAGRYKAEIDISKISTGVYYTEIITEEGCVSSTPLMIK